MKPILFNTEMARAILDGRKTVTRRLVKQNARTGIPYRPGDILYVRETWQFIPCIDCFLHVYGECGISPVLYEDREMVGPGCFIYRADYPERERVIWLPSIHMPKRAARLFLEVTDVQMERLQEITPAECIQEGIPREALAAGEASAIGQFRNLWDSTVQPAAQPVCGWDANPWVWVIKFKRVDKEE